LTKLLVGLAVVVLAGFVYLGGQLFETDKSPSNPDTAPAPVTTPQVDQELQQKRYDLIQDLIAQGIFSKVEVPGSLPHVWVTPMFHALNFDDKEAFIGVVFAYYIAVNPEYDIVALYDNKTGKEIGVFAEVYGGLKLD